MISAKEAKQITAQALYDNLTKDQKLIVEDICESIIKASYEGKTLVSISFNTLCEYNVERYIRCIGYDVRMLEEVTPSETIYHLTIGWNN